MHLYNTKIAKLEHVSKNFYRYIVSPPNTVCVATLPCKIKITTLLTFMNCNIPKSCPFYFANCRQFVSEIRIS